MSHAHKEDSDGSTASAQNPSDTNNTSSSGNKIQGVTERPVDALEPYEFSTEIFDQEVPNGRFIQSIKEGLEKPLIITESNEVIDGVRRLKAAEVLGWDDIKVEVRSFGDEREEKEAILRHNDHRSKTFSQKVRVAQEFEELIAPVMEKKMKNGTGVSRSDLDSDDELVQAALNGDCATRDLVGDRVGWSGETYRKAKKIWKAAHEAEWKNDDETIQLDKELQSLSEQVISKIDEGDQSISGGYKKIKRRIARSTGVSWMKLRSKQVSNELDKVEDEIPGSTSGWAVGLEETLNNYENSYGHKPADEYLPLIIYLLEQQTDVTISSDPNVVVDDISSRHPGQKRLEELYWEKNKSREKIAVCYGVTVPVINYWLREAQIELKRKDAPSK